MDIIDQIRSDVSIHAPVKGRPNLLPNIVPSHPVSIHAPVKGRLSIRNILKELS